MEEIKITTPCYIFKVDSKSESTQMIQKKKIVVVYAKKIQNCALRFLQN